jgi:hypothetical protein
MLPGTVTKRKHVNLKVEVQAKISKDELKGMKVGQKKENKIDGKIKENIILFSFPLNS